MLSAADTQIVSACGADREIGKMIAGSRTLVLAGLKESVTHSRVDLRDPRFEQYLRLKLRDRPHEELHAIFVDHAMGFLAEEKISSGTSQRVETRIAPIMRRVIELGAAGLVLVHNHPSHAAEPSPEDVRATHQIVTVARALDVTVFDHLIIAGNIVVSMRELGLV